MKFRKKPVIIDAIQWTPENEADALQFVGEKMSICYDFTTKGFRDTKIMTLEGLMRCEYGDYIIKGVKGEFYPCKPDIFEMTYEKVED